MECKCKVCGKKLRMGDFIQEGTFFGGSVFCGKHYQEILNSGVDRVSYALGKSINHQRSKSIMKIDAKIIEKLEKYFNCLIVGSYLFVLEGLLDKDDINDIDIIISEGKAGQAISFLRDEGYSIGFTDKYFQQFDCLYSCECEKENNINLHLMIHFNKEEPKKWGTKEILAIKVGRGNQSDYKQALKIIDKLLKENN